MIRLLLVLGVGLFLTLLIGGRDSGQTRLGLQGAYDIAVLKDAPAPAAPETPTPDATVVAVAEPAPAAPPVTSPRAAAPGPAPTQGLTEISFAPVTDSTDDAAETPGLTLSLPLVAAETDAAAPEPDPAPNRVARVIGSKVNVRAEPSAKAEVIGRLGRDQTVTVIEPGQSGWTRIRIEADGVEGFIASRYLAEAPADAEPAAAPSASLLFPSE